MGSVSTGCSMSNSKATIPSIVSHLSSSTAQAALSPPRASKVYGSTQANASPWPQACVSTSTSYAITPETYPTRRNILRHTLHYSRRSDYQSPSQYTMSLQRASQVEGSPQANSSPWQQAYVTPNTSNAITPETSPLRRKSIRTPPHSRRRSESPERRSRQARCNYNFLAIYLERTANRTFQSYSGTTAPRSGTPSFRWKNKPASKVGSSSKASSLV